MGSSSLFFLIIPLLIFVLVDTFASLNIALMATIIVAIGECLYSYIYFGELDSFSIFSLFLVIVLAAITFAKQSRKIFYLKPAILSFAMGGFLVVTYLMGEFVLYEGLVKYGDMISGQPIMELNNSRLQQVFKVGSLTLGLSLIIHGIVACYAALKLTRWWWFLVAGLGSYFFLIVGLLLAFFP